MGSGTPDVSSVLGSPLWSSVFFVPSVVLLSALALQEVEGGLGRQVGLSEDGDAGLLEDLGAGKGGGFGREVGIADARVGSREVLGDDHEVRNGIL